MICSITTVPAAWPCLQSRALSEYEVKVQLLVDAITINKQRIAAKIKEPTSIASLEDTDSLLIEIGTLIDGFNKKIKENNEIVRDLKTKKVLCKKQVWEYLAELLKADVAAYNKALSDLDTEIKALKDKMEQLKKDATAKKKEANELNKQIVNTEATIDMLQIRDILMKSDKLKTSAKNNTQQDFEFSYFDDIDDALIEGLSQNQDFFSMLLSNDEMKHQVMGIFSDEIYKSLRESV